MPMNDCGRMCGAILNEEESIHYTGTKPKYGIMVYY